MKIKVNVKFVWLLFIIVTGLSGVNLFSQESTQQPSRQSATDAFKNGNYEQAYSEFGLLLKKYSKDPLYKYYSGVCLVKLNKDPRKAVDLLQEAVKGTDILKNIPDDAMFYLGRSQQMSGLFTEAIKSFDLFTEEAGRKLFREYNVEKYIEECEEGTGALTVSKERLTQESQSKEVPEVLTREKGTSAPITENKQPVVKPVQKLEDTPEQFDKLLSEAMDYQVKADSLSALAFEYKRDYDNLPASQKTSAKARISELETLSAKYQKLADEKSGSKDSTTATQKDTITSQQRESVSDTSAQNAEIPVTDNSNNKEVKVQIPSSAKKSTTGYCSLFEIVTDSDAINNLKAPVDPELPAGLVYRIQMAVFSKPVAASVFKGISPISGLTLPGSQSIKYFAGMFRRAADANNALLTVKKTGFRDSFLSAVFDGKPVSLDRALLLEKEWGQKPLLQENSLPISVSTSDSSPAPVENVPATLTFRVELLKVAKPLKEEAVEPYRRMAGVHGLDILTSEDGSTVYLIGKFITFASASEYADLLRRNGYSEARVAAYLGNKEIPVETAKQLFEKLE